MTRTPRSLAFLLPVAAAALLVAGGCTRNETEQATAPVPDIGTRLDEARRAMNDILMEKDDAKALAGVTGPARPFVVHSAALRAISELLGVRGRGLGGPLNAEDW
jgi:hypothetical protein